MYEGNYIFEDDNEEFQVSVDKMGRMTPPYHIHFNQFKGQKVKIKLQDGSYASNAFNEESAIKRAYEMMSFINSKISQNESK